MTNAMSDRSSGPMPVDWGIRRHCVLCYFEPEFDRQIDEAKWIFSPDNELAAGGVIYDFAAGGCVAGKSGILN